MSCSYSCNVTVVSQQRLVVELNASTSGRYFVFRCRRGVLGTKATIWKVAQAAHFDHRQAFFCNSSGFHQSRLAATEVDTKLPPLPAYIRLAESDEDLQACAALRALSFYAYPPEREFAGKLHQMMMEQQEFQALKAQRLERRLAPPNPQERSAPLLALLPPETVPWEAGGKPALALSDASVAAGTCDVHFVRALAHECLIGNSQRAAYLANVCVAEGARRRNVGAQLLHKARALAVDWGADTLYVHIMARRFYEKAGFVVEKEESSNHAHYRGHCLDGIEGRGRTMLLKLEL